MDVATIVTIVSAILEGGGLAIFLGLLLRGVRQRLVAMNKTIEEQKRTMEVMERRVQETEKIGDVYRRLVRELPDDLEKYRALMQKLKDESMAELEKAVQLKDEKLRNITEIRLAELALQERIVTELPALMKEMGATVSALQERLAALARLSPPQWAASGLFQMVGVPTVIGAPLSFFESPPVVTYDGPNEGAAAAREELLKRARVLHHEAPPVGTRTCVRCGTEGEMVVSEGTDSTEYYVECPKCRDRGQDAPDRESAIMRWNALQST